MSNSSHVIHLTLKEMMEKKSKRDQISFTTYQLAKALSMPHSMLDRLIHPDPNKRVTNPRIDTLAKIVDFFRIDGFSITIDELLTGFKTNTAIDVQAQPLCALVIKKNVPIYSFTADSAQIGTADIKLASDAENVIALLSDEDIKPMFKKGSIFVVDTTTEPEHDNLVAVTMRGGSKIVIRKLQINGDKKVLKSHDNNVQATIMTEKNCSILGIIIQVNAKT